MEPNVERYGIFRKLPDGSPIWVGAENDLEKAMQKMRELASKDRMEYFVYDFRTGASIPLPPAPQDRQDKQDKQDKPPKP